MQIDSIEELAQNCEVNVGYIALISNVDITTVDNFEILHLVVYEEKPTEEDIQNLYNELCIDEEFGLCEEAKAGLLTCHIFTKEEYENEIMVADGRD
jgi:hypothetical protein